MTEQIALTLLAASVGFVAAVFSVSVIVDLNRHVVALVTDGDTVTNTIKGIAIQRCIPGIGFLVARGSGT